MGEKALRKTIAVAAALLLIVAGAVFILPRLEGAGESKDILGTIQPEDLEDWK